MKFRCQNSSFCVNLERKYKKCLFKDAFSKLDLNIFLEHFPISNKRRVAIPSFVMNIFFIKKIGFIA